MARLTGFFVYIGEAVGKNTVSYPQHCLHAITKHHNKGKDHGGAVPVNVMAEQIQGCFAPIHRFCSVILSSVTVWLENMEKAKARIYMQKLR